MSKRTLLIDGDVVVYQAATNNEYEQQWDHDLWTLHAHLDPAIAQLDDTIAALQEKLEADQVVIALTDYERPWRLDVMAEYKSQRKKTRKPIIYKPLREYVHERYKTFQRPGLEGDDCLGILLTADHFEKEYGERILVSIDKDMKTLPGLHFTMGKDEAAREIDLVSADRFHMYQTLTGDSTDGYKGCPGVGPKGAEKVLEGLTTVAEMWPAVVKAYEKAKLSETVALQNARVARICRASDYDFKNKKVQLWNPS